MALAPRTDQNMPEHLSRLPTTVRQPASTTPEPTNSPLCTEPRVAHAFGVALEVLGVVGELLSKLVVVRAQLAQASGELPNPSPERWFDTLAFPIPAPYTFGSSGPSSPWRK
jgi:hypothetical protein